MKKLVCEANNNYIDLLKDGNLVHWLASRKISNLGLTLTKEEIFDILKMNEIASVDEFINRKLAETRYKEGINNYQLSKRM